MKKKLPDLRDDETIKVPRFEESLGFSVTEKRSQVMRRIKSKDTKPEITFRKILWNRGYRYRLHSKNIIGKPDIIFKAKKIVVFIDGDFWHGHNWEEKKLRLKKNKEYWVPKIERNMQRDKEITATLKSEGWNVLRFWEHEIEKSLDSCISCVLEFLNF